MRVVKEFMEQHPFITLCGCDASGNPVATHVPVLLREKDQQLHIYGHIMRKTDHQLAFAENPNVLAIFSGPHTYVSASWYSNQRQGSSWNYMVVHAKGIIRFLDEAALHGVLRDLTARFENNPESPSLFEKLPDEYVSQMSKAIVAFEIEVKEMDNVFKLSQNRDEASFHEIIRKLEQQGGDAKKIAEEMAQRASALYSKEAVKIQSAGNV